MLDRFAVYHNIPKATEIKIHHIACSAYANRDPLAKNSDWHTASNLQTATNIAKILAREHGMRYRYCKWCMK